MRSNTVLGSLLAALLAGCSDPTGVATEPYTPQAPPTPPAPLATTATLAIRVDGGSCVNRVTNVRVFIDGQLSGTLQPGSGPVSKIVDIGNHIIAASGDRVGGGSAVTWSNLTVAVGASGYSHQLTCGASAPIPTTATIAVYVDGGSCLNKVTNVRVFIDGQLHGTLQPGSGQVSKMVDIGNHVIAASGIRSGGGSAVTWSNLTVAVGAGGYSQRLTCTNL